MFENKIENWLHQNLNELIYNDDYDKVEQFDFTYIDVIDYVLQEMYGKNNGLEKLRELKKLCNVSDQSSASILVKKITESQINLAHFTPKKSTDDYKNTQEFFKADSWEENKGLLVSSEENINKVNLLQKEYSIKSKGDLDIKFRDLGRPNLGDPWSAIITNLLNTKQIEPQEQCLSIGCRWVGEIEYFRKLGLRNMIGVDLFSRDSELIKICDMHQMPFPSNSIKLIYQRNTFDKSYNIRKAIFECLRVLKPGGFIIYDDVQGMTDGVNELTRTNIVTNKWILNYLNIFNCVDEIIYNKQEQSYWKFCKRIGRLAIKIRK